ncbi:CAMK/RAD53 protein kinase [Coprinopsis cinerea okayama7|uniref:CAMK/RAD53 protein kinase n=1 Tax=Coprinopsis cinerea (strain Okayama-7 / 130 / ATCC MYA-4618 / FGSC 9003) TaxID=240176 RepID=A8N5L4_COPC7|nr:CAMK/RAD53 protein kinase [Coprinopsis cinerea okayama7\|eukprot:XP_001830159.1 CAMK/RAD53 protein kinase [Coprinopsis cinerea okayama7\
MDDEFNEPMHHEAYDGEEEQQTQSTQEASQSQSQSPGQAVDAHLWGYLQPVNDKLIRIDFWRAEPSYTIGRNTTCNRIIFPGFKVSNKHCTITWNGSDSNGSVVVLDLSSNGTFINGSKIGKNNSRILRDGNEIAFGTPSPQPNNPHEDYRFIYRHAANGPPTTGLYAYYDVSTELGKGSFATVMKAVNRKTGVWYAVKMIKDKRAAHAGDIRNSAIAREISIMEKLKHRNICELKEVFMEEGSSDINLVLELVEGGDLLEYILNRGGLSEVDAKHITHQICSALSYIHQQGIAHRDLKPENVLLTKSNPPVVKVADFGLAKIVDSLTMLRTMCGTPSYLAPEVVKQVNQEGYDNLVDSWSVGVIVFSMLTNASPFIEDETQRDIRTRIAERRIDWSVLEAQNPSAECIHFIRSLLQEDPSVRMSLTQALDHPWLQSYIPVHQSQDQYLLAGVSSSPDVTSPSAGVSHDFIGLQIQPSAPRREGSRGAPLQRRSHVLSQAAEEGRPVPEPSPEMIAQATRSPRDQTKRNKRVRGNLTPLQEESDASGSSGNRAGSSSSNGKANKRPRLRSAADDDSDYD